MNKITVYELDGYDIRKALANYFGVEIEAIELSAETSIMGYDIEVPIKAKIKCEH